MKNKAWNVISSHDVSPSKWFPVTKEKVQLPNGKMIDYYKSDLANVSMIIPITKNKEIVFAKQYKHGIGEICVEFPSGRIEKHQTPEQAAVAELSEETGIDVQEKDLIKLTELWTEPSKSTVRVTGYLVLDIKTSHKQRLEETENIEVLKIPLKDLDVFIEEGNIHASDTVALLLYARHKYPQHFI